MDLPFRPSASVTAQVYPSEHAASVAESAFDRLPAELITLILAQAESPKDLGAFVRTCQRTYRVFQAHQTRILEGVIRNAFPGSQLCEAVGACKTWPLKTAYDHGQWVLLLPAQQWFLRQYWLSSSAGSVNLKEPGLLLAMYRLWWLLDRFIRSFFDDAIHQVAVEAEVTSLLPGWNALPDTEERHRIQRAFLRFELYRQLFPPIDGPGWFTNDWPYRSTHQYTPSLFLRQMPPWERYELLAVSQYLYETVRAMHLRIRQNLLRIVPPQESSEDDMVGLTLPDGHKLAYKVGIYERMIIFPEDHEQFKRHYSCIARLGLPFVSWLGTLPMADQVYILGLHWAEQAPKTIESEISYITRRDMSLTKWITGIESRSLAGPNLGWREIFKDRVREESLSTVMTCSRTPLVPRVTLQKMGFLFWSDARFARISFPPLMARDSEVFNWQLRVCDFAESKALQRSLRSCAVQNESFEDLWRTLQHSEQVDMLTDCFTRSYPPKEIMEQVPIYYGVVMSDADSAQLARQFMHERRELVNELVSGLSDIWLELVTTGPR